MTEQTAETEQATDPVAKTFELWRGMMAGAGEEPTIDDFRICYDSMFAKFEVDPEAEVEEVDADEVRCLSVTLSSVTPERDVVYFHGGGYMCGNPEGVTSHGAILARAARARVLLPDYRLAPENAHPAAHDDGVTAIKWLTANKAADSPIGVVGDSAGGGLVMSAVCSIRDAGDELPAAVAVWSPWVDMEVKGASLQPNAEIDPIASEQSLNMSAEAYLQGQDPQTPTANALFADLKGFPPLLVQTGEAEVLLDDSVRLAERGKEAGVDVTLERGAGLPHVYQFFASFLPQAREAIERTGAFFIKHSG